jgi:thioredoxin-like negative regulator of GroEL
MLIYVVEAIGLLVIVAIAWWITMGKDRAVPLPMATYDGPIDQYHGGKMLLVTVYAPWASVWQVTAEVLSKIDRARYDLKLINVDHNRPLIQQMGVDIIPTVIAYRDGKELVRIPNLMSMDQLRAETQP